MGNTLTQCVNSGSASKTFSSSNSQGVKTGTVDESDVIDVISNSIKAVMEVKNVPKKYQETQSPWSNDREFYRVSTIC